MPEQSTICGANGADLAGGKAVPLQAYLVDSPHYRWMPVRDAKRKDVLGHFFHSADKCKPTYSDKLHDARHAVDDGMIAYLDVSGLLCVATDHDVVTNYSVVCYMAVREKHPVAAYHSGFSRLRRGVHCREFAEDISAAHAGKH